MPKTYSEQERAFIKHSLKLHALECLSTYGIKKTTVDELVKRARIPKGTFYLFYESKEVLLFEVIMEFHNKIQDKFLMEVKEHAISMNAKVLTSIFLSIAREVRQSGFLEILTGGEMEVLIRKLPREHVVSHLNHDDDMVKQLITILPEVKEENTEKYSAALRAIFLAMLHQQEIGEGFEDALELLVEGVCIQLLGGKYHD